MLIVSNTCPPQSELESVSDGYLFFKFILGPGLIYVEITGLHSDRPLSLVVTLPLILAGAFSLMVTRVKPDSSVLSVRRFWGWQEFAYSEIKDCDDNLLMPFIGSVRLRRYIPPFGKIYFWIPISRRTSRIDKELIAHIRHRAGLGPD